jgi:hypothetical protein
MIKLRKVRWAKRVACMWGGGEECIKYFGGKAKRKETTRMTHT